MGVLSVLRRAFDYARFKLHTLATSLQQHDRADWKRLRDTGDERPNVAVIPDPAPLEVGELNLALVNLIQQLGPVGSSRPEGASRITHDCFLSSVSSASAIRGDDPRRLYTRKNNVPSCRCDQKSS